MIALLVAIVLCILLGGISMWISGFLYRNARGIPPMEKTIAVDQTGPLRRQIDELSGQVFELQAQRKALESTVSVNTEISAEADFMKTEMSRLENEKSYADAELVRLNEECAQLRGEMEASKLRNKPRLPIPVPLPSPTFHHESDELDTLGAQLDIERVAHQKTREELEQVKKIAALKLGGANLDGSDRRPFQTMAISTRGTSLGGDGEGLQNALEKIQAEKDQIESELVRTRQELQFLKMRQ